ncbi:MAG: putative quinol monooxygenase [bacterium]
MPAIGAIAVITARPGAEDEVADLLYELVTATQAEAGCLLYSLQRGLEEPNVFVTVEKWASPDALQAHLSSPHVATALGRAGELLTEAPRIISFAPTGAGDTAKGTF